MGGFVVTCADGGYHMGGVKEAIFMLQMAIFDARNKRVQETSDKEENAKDIYDIYAQLIKERKEIKKTELFILGGKRDSEILFIRNDTEVTEIEIYNMLIAHTKRAEYVRRVIPVKSIFTLTVENLVKETKKVCEGIGACESFRISLSKRLCTHISSDFIITKIAEEIPRKVSLKNPDKVVIVEIVKDLCAIGLVKPCPGNFNITRRPRAQ